MKSVDFDSQLEFGGTFEDVIIPKIAEIFNRLDPMSTYINSATSKTDKKHSRGQRLIHTQDASASYMLPDMLVFSNKKQYSIEMKCKDHYYSSGGELYAVIDLYKIRDYENSIRFMGFDHLYYVFGDRSLKVAHMATKRGTIAIIPEYKGEFMMWNIKDLRCIGKW